MIFPYRSHGSGSWSRPGNGATGHSESMGKFLKLVPCEKYEEDQVSSNSFRTLMKLWWYYTFVKAFEFIFTT